MLNFDADVKKTTARHQCENRFLQDLFGANVRTERGICRYSHTTILHMRFNTKKIKTVSVTVAS